MAATSNRLWLLCLMLVCGNFAQQTSGQQTAPSAAPPCSALVDTDAPEQWQAVGDVPSQRQAAFALLEKYYADVGGPAACGPLVSNHDTDILILGACTKGSLTAMLIYARYTCKNRKCAGGQPCIYGTKLLGTARLRSGTEPRVAQLDAVPVQPSVPPAQGTGVVKRSGLSYLKSEFAPTGPLNLNYKALLTKTTRQVAAIYRKSAGRWRLVSANPAAFGSGYPGLVPPPKRASAPLPNRASPGPLPPQAKLSRTQGFRSLLQSSVCLDITEADGFEDATGTVPSTLIAGSLQAVFLIWYNAAGPEAARACPQLHDKATGKIDLAAVQIDVMQVCRKAIVGGVSYGLRFTAYFPCSTAQGRYEVLDATVFQPGPTHAAAFGPTELFSLPPTSTEGLGWGANVGISSRLRLTAEFTRASFVQATDIAVDPSHPSDIWIVGPVNESALSPSCGKPYGGPLLKWTWGTSSFKPVAGVKAAGVRVTVMPETHKPWIVDECGQLRGWSPSLKNIYGPVPHGKTYDVAAVNGTVFSGCASYNPSTFAGNIAAGCWPPINVAVGPGGALHTTEAGDLTVTADGYELLTSGQDVLYKDPALGRLFRLYRAPDGYRPLRISAGNDGSVWLVMAPSTMPTTGLAGVYRGFTARLGQPRPPSWPKTCADVDPGCADGGCDAGLKRCLRCAAPRFVMGSSGKCQPVVCTDVDPNCAECGLGAACTTCKPGYVRGYHSGDTLCRRPIKGPVTCWTGAAADSKQQAVGLGNNTWQHLATSRGFAVFVDTAGNVRTSSPEEIDLVTSFSTKGAWRAASRAYNGWYGITTAGKLAYANRIGGIASPPVLKDWPDLGNVRMLTVTSESVNTGPGPLVCLITTGNLARCKLHLAFAVVRVQKVQAVCLAAADVACFLDIYGEVHCFATVDFSATVTSPIASFTPPGTEPWVEIVCGSSIICAKTSSGRLSCFPLLQETLKLRAQLSSRYVSLGAFHMPGTSGDGARSPSNRQRLCGIDTARRLQCTFVWKNPETSQEFSKLVTLEPTRAWAAVAVTYDNVCAIPAN